MLGLFSADRDQAAYEYEKLRDGLIRFFRFRGSSDPERLADETFNRVASKAELYEQANIPKPVNYVYGFARNILREQSRNPERSGVQLEPAHWTIQAAPDADADPDPDPDDLAYECLTRCLEEIPARERRLILEYYSRERREKIALRKKMAEILDCRPEVLQMKIFRLKGRLRTCVEDCKEKSVQDF